MHLFVTRFSAYIKQATLVVYDHACFLALVHGKSLLISYFCISSLLASPRPIAFLLFLVFICSSLNCRPRDRLCLLLALAY